MTKRSFIGLCVVTFLIASLQPLTSEPTHVDYVKRLRIEAKGLVTLAPPYESTLSIYNYEGQSRSFYMDCDGFARGLFYCVGIDVARWGGVQTVPEMYNRMRKAGEIYRRTRPSAGDLVFFDNTWDRNKNGRCDDVLSHVGIVLDVDENGRITFVHISTSSVRISYANLEVRAPDMGDGTIANHFLGEWKDAEKRDALREDFLACDLINSFGRVAGSEAYGARFTRKKQYKGRSIIGINTVIER